MNRPNPDKYDTADKIGCFELIRDFEEYCTLLEQTISALRDDYSEQVKVTAELRRRYQNVQLDGSYIPGYKAGFAAARKEAEDEKYFSTILQRLIDSITCTCHPGRAIAAIVPSRPGEFLCEECLHKETYLEEN